MRGLLLMTLLVAMGGACLVRGGAEGAGAVIATMDEMRFRAPQQKGQARVVEGKVGKAERFDFEKDCASVFFTSNIHGTAEWDRAEGFSFWVKAEGETAAQGAGGFGGLEFIYDEDYAVRYDVAFPVQGDGWTKVTVAWRDLVPVLPGPRALPLSFQGGNRPSKLSALWVGKWWYWGTYPAVSFAIDDIRLESRIAKPARIEKPAGAPLARVREKLKAGQPITIVTMGDSLTDVRHWANREVRWPELLKGRLAAKFGSNVTIVNPAIGGTQLRQNVVLIPTWLGRAPEPDLVTIFFGGNDWDAGMRGEEFKRACAEAVDRIRAATKGRAEVLIVTTNPSAARWDELAPLAEACRAAARDRNAGLADTDRAFHTAAKSDDERARLFVHDRVHLSPAGHALVSETVLTAIETGGR